MPSPPPKKRTTLHLTADVIRSLKAEAAMSGVTVSDLVAEMLNERRARFRQQDEAGAAVRPPELALAMRQAAGTDPPR